MNVYTKIRKTILTLSLAVVALLASALPASAQYSVDSVTICNYTGLDIYDMHLSPVDSVYWGFNPDPGPDPGPLGGNGVEDGTCRTISGIPAGRYDLEVIDATGDSCFARDILIDWHRRLDLTMAWLVANCE